MQWPRHGWISGSRKLHKGEKEMNPRAEITIAQTLLVLCLCGLAAQAQSGTRSPAKTKNYRFDTVDYPGASSSYLSDINQRDKTAVGYFFAGPGPSPTAFTFKGTTYKVIQVPGATASALLGINSSDQMVGYYVDSGDLIHGFLDNGGKFTVLDYPGAEATEPFGINGSGAIVGSWYAESEPPQGFL